MGSLRVWNDNEDPNRMARQRTDSVSRDEAYDRAAQEYVKASQDHTSQKEVMEHNLNPQPEYLYGSPVELSQKLDERHKVLLQTIEGLQKHLSDASMELRMINAAPEQYNTIEDSTPAIKYDVSH